MHIDGGGGYAGSTNWYSHNMDSIWKKVENQQTDGHWSVVTGWQMAGDLAATHVSRLTRFRDELAEAWPPEKSEAARVYIERFNFLIDTVQQTYEVATANYATFKAVTQAIYESRRDIEPIYQEYLQKEKAKADYEAEVERNKMSLTPPIFMANQQVTEDDLERVTDRARSIMHRLSNELGLAQAQIKAPPTYKPGRVKEDGPGGGTGSGGAGDGGGGFIGSPPPVIPPITMMSGNDVQSSGTPRAVAPVPMPTAPGTGPVLGGTIAPAPPINPLAPSVITPGPPPPPTGGPHFTPTLPPGPLPSGGFGKGYPSPSTMPPGAINTGGAPVKTGPGGFAGGPRAMPPGGMINGMPGAGLGQPAPGAGAARRINPVGGVIGSGAGGGTPIGGAGQRLSGGMPVGGIGQSAGTAAGRMPAGGAGQAIGTGTGRTPIGGAGQPIGTSTGRTPIGGAGQPIGTSTGRTPIGGAGQPMGTGTGRTFAGGTGSGGASVGARGQASGVTSSGGNGQRGINEDAWQEGGWASDSRQRWDPENPWETDAGVSPVVLPARENGRIDPGPAIGLNR